MSTNKYRITSQRILRREFWAQHPTADRSKRHGDYLTDTRCLWVEYIDAMQRDGTITEALAKRATLLP